MGHNSAQDTSGVTGGESDSELGGFAIRILWASKDISIEKFDNLLEENEFHNSVWDLSGPEWG